MKKFTLLFILFFIFYFDSLAQETKEPKGFLKFGTGYYLDLSFVFDNEDFKDYFTGIPPEKTVGGKTIWIEGGYMLPNRLIISVNAMYASLKRKYKDFLYQGQKYLIFHQNYSLNVSYEFNHEGNHKFLTGVGLLYNMRSTTEADYSMYEQDGEYYFSDPRIIEQDDEELGINLNLDYYYQFKNNFFIGARVNTVYLLSIGLEYMAFTPVFGAKF